jgi:hypothetical protein
VKEKMRSRIEKLKATLKGKRAEGYVDTAVKMITAVVIGGLLLAGLYAMFNNVMLPGLAERIQVMFN